jgi:hypothetical protein
MPPGAEGLSTVIATQKLTLREAWNPEPVQAKLGSAFTRTVTLRATEVPGIVLPPQRWDAPKGIGVYRTPATVTDSSERGEVTGQRVESVTYVCEQPGTYRLPGITLAWWDAEQKKLQHEQLPSHTIEVQAGPSLTEASEPPPIRKTHAAAWLLAGALVLTTLAVMYWLIRKPLSRWLAKHRAAQADSEAAWFSRVRAACREGSPQQIEQAILAWLDHVPNKGHPWRLSDLAECSPDAALRAQIAGLHECLYGKGGESFV